VDFDRINAGETRLSIGAVNVRSGNFVYFDNSTRTITVDHVLASGSLPPGFPAVEIEGEQYWDGGVVSNTPLSWCLGAKPRQDMLVFQVDLWSARGKLPGNMLEVLERQKDIQYSSRTRLVSDMFKTQQQLRCTAFSLLKKLPEELLTDPEVEFLRRYADHKVTNLVHLIYRSKNFESHSKDYEFSRSTMHSHSKAGYNDTVRTLRHPKVLQRPDNMEGFAVFDTAADESN